MDSFNLQHNNFKDVKRHPYQLAILPWGATEAHNLHLPYGTDTILAETVALQSAALAWEHGAKCIVLPPVPFGVNTGQLEVKLCLNLNPSTQKLILGDLLISLEKAGIRKLVILNAHGGNNFQPLIRELSVEHPEFLICSINWWQVCKPDTYFTIPGDHAGEIETAAMLATRPELVLPLEEAGKGKEIKMGIKGFRERWAWIPRRWIYATEDTGIGDPQYATAENGEKFVTDCVKEIAGFLIDFSKIKEEKELYLPHE